MKKPREIRWARVAENDLLGIMEIINLERPETPKLVLKKLRDRTCSLARTPQRGRIVPELLKQGISRYRGMTIKPWRVIYRTEAHEIFIVAVIDGRRNVEDILLARMIR